MQSLDPGQQRELEWRRRQPSAWVKMSLRRRLVVAAVLIVWMPVLVALLIALAGGPWLLVGAATLAGMSLLVLPNALFPELMLRRGVRMMPTEEAMRRGDKVRQNWPG